MWQMHVMYEGWSRGVDEGGGYVDRWPPPSLSPYFFLLSSNSPFVFSPNPLLSIPFPSLPPPNSLCTFLLSFLPQAPAGRGAQDSWLDKLDSEDLFY